MHEVPPIFPQRRHRENTFVDSRFSQQTRPFRLKAKNGVVLPGPIWIVRCGAITLRSSRSNRWRLRLAMRHPRQGTPSREQTRFLFQFHVLPRFIERGAHRRHTIESTFTLERSGWSPLPAKPRDSLRNEQSDVQHSNDSWHWLRPIRVACARVA
jgi:hypothetical protein